MVNLALNGVFIPGSVFKPVVALAALQEGVISAGTTYTCGGVWNYFDLSQGCLCGGGTRNLYGALAHSCNTYFSNVGLNLGIARLAPYAEYLGWAPPLAWRLANPRAPCPTPRSTGKTTV